MLGQSKGKKRCNTANHCDNPNRGVKRKEGISWAPEHSGTPNGDRDSAVNATTGSNDNSRHEFYQTVRDRRVWEGSQTAEEAEHKVPMFYVRPCRAKQYGTPVTKASTCDSSQADQKDKVISRATR